MVVEELGGLHARSTWWGSAVPLRATVMVGLVDEVLEIANWPDKLPTVVGVKVSVRFRDWPGLSFAGRLAEDVENPLPLTVMELTVTAAVPVDVSVTDCVVEWFTTSDPNEMLLALTVRAGVAALSWSEIDFDVLVLDAVSDADVAVVTAATLAVKVAEVAVAGIVTEAGTVTEPLLLTSATLTPPEGAVPESVTLQESASAPVMDVLPHASALMVGTVVEPVPLRLTAEAGALLETESCPETEPVEAGLNWTDNTSACPGFKVTGTLPPETEKPAPEIESALIDTGALPLDVTVTDFVTAVPTETFPNANEDVLRVSAGVPVTDPDPLSLMEVDFDVDPCVAVRVTVCEAVTAETVAGKDALFAPEGIVKVAGTLIAALLLARVTANPADGAAAVKVTVQLSVPAPIIEALAQTRLESAGVPELEPLPCSLIDPAEVVVLLERLVAVTSSVPVESVVDFAS
jgi:hypothetical protein